MSRMFDDYYYSSGRYCLDYPENYVFVNIDEDGEYGVCEEGFVCHNGKLLKNTRGDDHGHKAVTIRTKDGKEKKEYVHRLVAKAFIPNPNNYPYVRHLNDDPSDNRVENLAWGTQMDNYYDSVANRTATGFTEEIRRMSIEKCRRPVRVIDINTGNSEDFYSLNEACRSKGIIQANACKVLKGERSHANGYRLEYLKKEGDCND